MVTGWAVTVARSNVDFGDHVELRVAGTGFTFPFYVLLHEEDDVSSSSSSKKSFLYWLLL